MEVPGCQNLTGVSLDKSLHFSEVQCLCHPGIKPLFSGCHKDHARCASVRLSALFCTPEVSIFSGFHRSTWQAS